MTYIRSTQRFLIFLLLAIALAPAQAALKEREIRYQGGGVEMRGFLVYDDSLAGRRPGVLVVHEWWGHNTHARNRARKLAEAGYVAFALDMYGDGRQAAHPDDAKKFSSAVFSNLAQARARFEAALAVLKKQPQTDPERIAAIGYCFGGGVVLHMARMGVDLRGVASFHGSIATRTPAQPGKVKASILVLNGADDPFVTPEQITVFKKEMQAAGVDYTFVNYAGARHSFTNPAADDYGKRFGLPLAYNAEADARSWKMLLAFFQRIFK